MHHSAHHYTAHATRDLARRTVHELGHVVGAGSEREKGRREVDVSARLVVHGARLDAGPADQQWHPDVRVVRVLLAGAYPPLPLLVATARDKRSCQESPAQNKSPQTCR
eukprot:COSAG01_NODE_380_length_17862_cov_20.427212_23_plen_109_part_00